MADFDNSSDAWRVNIPGNGSTVELVGNAREGSTCLKMVINPDNIRNEIVKQSLFAWGEDYWVGYSIKVVQPVSGYNIITQHRPFPSGPNSFTMRTLDNSTIRMYTSTNDAIKNDVPGNAGTWGGVPQDLNYNIGEWIDIVMNFKLDPDNGYYKVWANGNLIIDINGGTTVYLKDLDGNLKDPLDYAKIGLYYGDDRTSGEIHFDSYKVWEGTGGTYEDVSPGSEPPNIPTITLSERNAFPSAVGFGQNATGGRGGRIIEVTNLNASGAGSFANAVNQTGPRIVIFRVGGTIDMGGSIIFLDNPDITIAGETAPGDGILVRGGTIAISTSNVIIRHIRFRGSAPGDDALRIRGFGANYTFPISDIIVDHCSLSWSNDENISVINARDVTIQNCIISNSTYAILAWSNRDLSVLNNIMALTGSRGIETNQQLGTYLVYEEINNLVYGFNWYVGHGKGLMATIENNIFEDSNDFSSTTDYAISFTEINPDYYETSNPAEMTYVYHSGNTVDASFTAVYDGRSGKGAGYEKIAPLYRSSYEPRPTAGLKDKLLQDVGALPWNRDSVDNLVITNVTNKTGSISTSGTFPTIANGTPYTDSNSDGISDTWATLHGISSASQVKSTYTINGKTIINDAGYTALEIFFADIAGDFERLPLDIDPDPDPDPQPGTRKGFNRNILLTLD